MKIRRAFGLLVMAFGFLMVAEIISLSTADLQTEYWKVSKTVYSEPGSWSYMKVYRCNADWSVDYSWLALPMPAADDPLTAGYWLKDMLTSYHPVSAVYVGEEEEYWRYQVFFESGYGTVWPSGSGDTGGDDTATVPEPWYFDARFLGACLVLAGWLVYRKR